MISRRAAIRAILAAPVAGAVNSALAIEYNDHRLTPHLDGEYLHVSTPNFNFLTARSLQRLWSDRDAVGSDHLPLWAELG